MLRSAQNLWNPLTILCNNSKICTRIECFARKDSPAAQIDIFSDICAQALQELISLLEIFENFTMIIQADKSPTIVEGCLIYNRLFSFFNEKTSESNSGFTQVFKLMRESLEEVIYSILSSI